MGGEQTHAAIPKLDFLVRSPSRVALLAMLAEGEARRSDLRARCDASRTTLRRNLEALEERGWIQHTNRTYTLTKQGAAVTDRLLTLLETIRTTTRLQPVLQWLPDEAFELDPRMLADATVVTSTAGDPYALQNRYIDRLREVRQIRALLPMTGVRSWEAARDRTCAGDLACELVVSPTVARTIRSSPQYKGMVEDVLETDRHEIFVADGPLPYALAIMDEYTQLVVADEDAMPRALVESDREEVAAWAAQTYETYKRQAEPLSTTGSA